MTRLVAETVRDVLTAIGGLTVGTLLAVWLVGRLDAWREAKHGR